MRFYYENKDFRNIPNGKDFCGVSNLDWNFGYQYPVFEITDEPTIWGLPVQRMESHVIEDNIEYFKNMFNIVKDKPNIKIAISNFHEGAYQNEFIKKLISLKNQFKIPSNQIFIFTNNQYAEIYSGAISIVYKPYLLGFLMDNYRGIKDESIYHNGSEIGLLSSNEYLNSEKKKFFLSYNKNTTKTFRIQLLLWLIKTGYIDDSYVSILIKNEYFDRNNLRSKEDELYDLVDYYNRFEGMGFNVLDWNYPEFKNDVFSSLKYTTKSHYADTVFNIITETTSENHQLNLTEKSFKAMANCHPYLVLGDVGTHQHIKDLGFNLYEDLIDYSFDSIENNGERLSQGLKQIRRMHALGKDGIMNWYRNNIEKIEENKSKLFTYCFSKMIDESILILKESFTSESYEKII
jgi:hypothetical protein